MADNEMSMDEVLSSIRKILAKDTKVGEPSKRSESVLTGTHGAAVPQIQPNAPMRETPQNTSADILELKDVVKKPKEKPVSSLQQAFIKSGGFVPKKPALNEPVSPAPKADDAAPLEEAAAAAPASEENAPLSPSSDVQGKKRGDLASQIEQQQRLSGGLEGFLLASLKSIIGDYFEEWAKDHVPQMAERVLKEQIRSIFKAYENKRPS